MLSAAIRTFRLGHCCLNFWSCWQWFVLPNLEGWGAAQRLFGLPKAACQKLYAWHSWCRCQYQISDMLDQILYIYIFICLPWAYLLLGWRKEVRTNLQGFNKGSQEGANFFSSQVLFLDSQQSAARPVSSGRFMKSTRGCLQAFFVIPKHFGGLCRGIATGFQRYPQFASGGVYTTDPRVSGELFRSSCIPLFLPKHIAGSAYCSLPRGYTPWLSISGMSSISRNLRGPCTCGVVT